MRPILLGTPDDVLGFTLGGTTAITTSTRDDVQQAIRRIVTTVEDPIIIFSHDAAELIPEEIRLWKARGSGPMFVVLPEERPCR